MKNKKRFSMLLCLIMASSLFISCSKKEEENTSPLTRTGYFMGTVVTMTLYDSNNEEILDKAFKEVERIEELVSINKEGTEVDEINANAGLQPVKVSQDTYNIIEKGLAYSKNSNGYFDITIGPLVKLWSIGLPEAKVPTDVEIQNALLNINYNNLILDKENLTVFLKEKNMILDLGGIAKGYTADVVAQTLKKEGVNSAIIDLGGNIFALGEKKENTLWKIGVQNPELNRGEIVGTLSVKNKSVVTSGIYERYLEENGKRYHHILSPYNGYPYDNNITGVSIISDLSIDGDGLSTSVFAMGIENGLEYINSIDNVEAVFIDSERNVYLSNGASQYFTLTNKDFTLK